MIRLLMKGRTPSILLLLISLTVHFAFIGTPSSAVFDEVHFGKFVTAYFTHEYYFDIHPPLGKLLIATWGWLWGFQPGFSFASIGEAYPDHLYIALRALPSLAGALLPLVIYGIARRLRISKLVALLAGLLVALDNALLVQSRYILLDAFLLLFGFTAYYCYLRWRDTSHAWLLVCTGIFGAAAFSIKWTGATFLALIMISECIRLLREPTRATARHGALLIVTLIVIPLSVYAESFAIHFALLTKSGSGDAFMSPAFQSGLIGNRHAKDASLTPPNFTEKLSQLNLEMYRANNRLTATHPYSSSWYSWPLMQRPIFYWINQDARIYLLGNPVVWWLSTAAVITLLLQIFTTRPRHLRPISYLLAGAWLINILPFIGIHRVMFLYHYFTALAWAILILAFIIDQMRFSPRALLGIAGAALVLFVFFAPLSYGTPLTPQQYAHRVWLSSWR